MRSDYIFSQASSELLTKRREEPIINSTHSLNKILLASLTKPLLEIAVSFKRLFFCHLHFEQA